MCLYTKRHTPIYLDNVPAYKLYLIRDGKLSAPFYPCYITSLQQVAEVNDFKGCCDSRVSRGPCKNLYHTIESGYVHASLSLDVGGVASAKYFFDDRENYNLKYVIVEGRLSGPGYYSLNGKDACATSFILEDIVDEN